MPLQQIIDAWNLFFHAEVSCATFVIFRIAIGILLLANVLLLIPLIEEIAMGTLIWVRELRYPMLLSGIALHLMLDIIMNLQFFSWIMICSLLLFVFPEDAESWLVYVCHRFQSG